MITSSDEELHQPTGERHWQESYYFNWSDPTVDAFGLARIGFQPQHGRAEGLLLTMRDGRPEFLYPALAVRQRAAPSASDGLRTRGLTFRMDEPLSRWQITLDGPNWIDLTWTAVSETHDIGDSGLEKPSGVASHHFEQVGTVAGTVHVHGTTYQIRGTGHRDKSWGPRDWAGIKGWDWVSAQFGTDLAFNATSLPLHGELLSGGWIHRDGKNRTVVDVSIDHTCSRRRHVPDTTHLHLVDDHGDHYDVTASSRAQFPLTKRGLFIQETQADFRAEINGEPVRDGAGIVEHSWHAGRLGASGRLPEFLSVALRTLPRRFQ